MIKMVTTERKEQTGHIGLFFMVKLGLSLAGAFLLANSTISGAPSALNVALVGTLSGSNIIAGFAGSLIAYFTSGLVSRSGAEILAMAIVIVAKLILTEMLKKKVSPLISALIVSISMLMAGVGVTVLSSLGGTAIFVQFCRALLCGFACFFFIKTSEYIKRENAIPVAGMEGMSLAVTFTLVISALSSIEIGSLNLGRIIGVFAVLCALKRYKLKGAALVSIFTLCGIVLCSPELGQSTMMLPISALIAVMLTGFGSIAIAFAFIAANAVGLVIIGASIETFTMLIDVFGASMLFVLIPERLINTFTGTSNLPERNQGLLSARMDFAADAVKGVKESVEQVATALNKYSSSKDIVAQVSDEICVKCRESMTCWERNFEQTHQNFVQLKIKLNEKNMISDEDMRMFSNCTHKNELINTYNSVWQRTLNERTAAARLSESREILYEQFSAIEELLRGIGEEAKVGREYDTNAANAVKAALSSIGARGVQATVYYDTNGKMFVEAFYFGTVTISDEELCLKISDTIDCDLDIPQTTVQNGVTRLCMWEKTQYRLEIGKTQKPCEGNICGDTCESFTDGLGNAYVVISDGMGTGKHAALDSVMTASLLKKFLSAGVEYGAAIKLINSSMLLKSSEERFATLDIACVNLYTGKLDIIKSGAAATFIRMKDKVKKIECTGMPIGISSRCAPVFRSEILEEGDCVLMVSDGVDNTSPTDIRDILLRSEEISSNEISRSIIEKSTFANKENRADDMTAVAVKVVCNKM